MPKVWPMLLKQKMVDSLDMNIFDPKYYLQDFFQSAPLWGGGGKCPKCPSPLRTPMLQYESFCPNKPKSLLIQDDSQKVQIFSQDIYF